MSIQIRKVFEKIQNVFTKLVIISLLFSFADVSAQTVLAQATSDFEITDGFSGGKLTVTLGLNPSPNTAEVVITLPDGFVYKANSVTKVSGNGDIAYASTSGNEVKFNITNITGGQLVFSIEKTITKDGHTHYLRTQGQNAKLQDGVKLTQGSTTNTQKSNDYSYKFPVLSVEQPQVHNDAGGNSGAKTFKILNGGYGKVKTIYFSIEYLAGVTYNKVSYAGTQLTPLSSSTAQKKYFSIGEGTSVSLPGGGLTNNQSIEITEEYNVTGCADTEITYETGWGEKLDNLYQTNSAKRSLKMPTGTPKLELVTDNDKTYFERKGKLCDAGVFGTVTVTYKNNGTATNKAAAMYDMVWRIMGYQSSGFTYYQPKNVRLVKQDGTDGASVTIPASQDNTAQQRTLDLNFTTDPDGAGYGLEDLDGDGDYNDLASGQSFTIRFDYERKDSFSCLIKDWQGDWTVAPSTAVNYSNSCGTKIVAPNADYQKVSESTFRIFMLDASDASFAPVNLTTDEAQTAAVVIGLPHYAMQEKTKGAALKNVGRFKYVIKLPAGLVAENVKMVAGESYSPAHTNINTTNITNTTTGGNGGEITAITPNENRWYVKFDLKRDCSKGGGGEKKITYETFYIDGYNTSYQCDVKILCGEQPVVVVCPGNCGQPYPSLTGITARRADNSLGWTDEKMTTRINPTDTKYKEQLKRALYLDEVDVTANGTTGGDITNLHYRAEMVATAKLEPKRIKVTIQDKDGNTLVNAQEIPLATALVKETDNIFEWDITSALPTGGVKTDYKFSVTTTYQVMNESSAEAGKNHMGCLTGNCFDVKAGHESYFYTLIGGDKKFCGAKLAPDFTIANTYIRRGSNTYNIKGCEETPIGSSYMLFTGRRFESNGTRFTPEFRPDRKIKTFTITFPKAYVLKKLLFAYVGNDDRATMKEKELPWSNVEERHTATQNIYVYKEITDPNDPGYLNPGQMNVANGYSNYIKTIVQASCASKTDNTESASIDVAYEDFYYHYKANGGSQVFTGNPLSQTLYYTEKPSVRVTTVGNATIKVNKKVQEIQVKLENNSLSTAPYTWLSIPSVTGLRVLEVKDSSGNVVTAQTGSAFSGENMYHLSTTGIEKGKSEVYTIKIELDNCQDKELKVYGGWNCANFPTAGYQTTCSAGNADNVTTFTINPVKSTIQVLPISENAKRSTQIKMCEPTEYEYELNSAGEGNIIEPVVSIARQAGLEISDFQMQYPATTGTWQAITMQVVGNLDVFELKAHSAYPQEGLPGTIAANGVENNRKVRIKFKIKPECGFTAGSSFDIQVTGKNICQEAVDGNKVSTITAGIIGLPTNQYTINNTLNYQSGNASNCVSGNGALFKGVHTISSTDAGFSTGPNGRVLIAIPEGFEYVTGTFVVGTKNQKAGQTMFGDPSIDNAQTTATELSIVIPQGMYDSASFEYTINIRQKSGVLLTDCDVKKELVYRTIDAVSNIPCAGSTCGEVKTETSQQRGREEIKVERPELSITDVQVSASEVVAGGKEKITFTYKVKNTSTTIAYSGNLRLDWYYDTNNDGKAQSAESIFNKIYSGQAIPANGEVSLTETIEIEASKVCKLLLQIANEHNTCLCSPETPVSITAPAVITKVVNDLTLCETDTATFVAPVASSYLHYEWSVEGSTPATALSYLSNASAQLPTFTYTGTALTTARTFTYNIKVTRPDGCQATQKVTVTVNPAPTAPIATPKNYVGTKTVQDLINDIKSENPTLSSATIKVYDSAGTELSASIPLTSATYRVSATQAGQCESKKTDVTVTVTQTPPTLFGISPICATTEATIKTIKDAVQVANSAVTNIKVYVNSVEITDETTKLDATKTYEVTAEKGGITTDKLTISVTKQTETPGNNKVHFCDTETPTVANLKTKLLAGRTGVTIKVYASDNVTSHPNPMADTDAVTDQGVYSYTETNTGECESVRKNVTITIINKPVISSNPYNFCSGKTIVDLKQQINPADANAVKVYKNGTEVNNTTALVAGTYEVTKFSTECETDKVSVTVALSMQTAISSHPVGGKAYCKGTTAETLSVTATGTNITYQWYENAINSNTGGTAISGETSSTYTPSTNVVGKKYYYVQITGTCGTEISNVAEIDVKDVPASPTVTSRTDCPSSGQMD
ncbi:MAG: hypothetical protein Q3983_09680, partial [Capnocytophaga sp.]|nr:hypothetical protein [Capnocytophaga sp.]